MKSKSMLISSLSCEIHTFNKAVEAYMGRHTKDKGIILLVMFKGLKTLRGTGMKGKGRGQDFLTSQKPQPLMRVRVLWRVIRG